MEKITIENYKDQTMFLRKRMLDYMDKFPNSIAHFARTIGISSNSFTSFLINSAETQYMTLKKIENSLDTQEKNEMDKSTISASKD